MCSRVHRVRVLRCRNRFIRQNAKTIASKVQGLVKQPYDLHTGPVSGGFHSFSVLECLPLYALTTNGTLCVVRGDTSEHASVMFKNKIYTIRYCGIDFAVGLNPDKLNIHRG